MFLSQVRQKETSKVFNKRHPELRRIQDTVTNEIIPDVVREIKKSEGVGIDERLVKWLEEWVSDTGQIFRIYKVTLPLIPSFGVTFYSLFSIQQQKNDFDVVPTIAAIRQTLLWRIRNLVDLQDSAPSTFIRFLHHPLLDYPSTTEEVISTQPILYIGLGQLTTFAKDGTKTASEKVEEVKNILLNTYEAGRMYMKDLDNRLQSADRMLSGTIDDSALGDNLEEEASRMRIVQFVMMVDVQGAGLFRELGSDISSWLSREVAPNFPGVCNAVYVVNYSWAYSALWGFIKRFLPAKVLSRISFFSTEELLQHFPPACILEEHGGLLPPFDTDSDPILDRYLRPRSTPSDSTKCATPSISSESSNSSNSLHSSESPPFLPLATSTSSAPPPLLSSPEDLPPPTIIDPFSPSNPYFGYPTIVHHQKDPQTGRVTAVPRLLHGRRRKRDLVRALAFLFFLKWKRHAQQHWIHVNDVFRSRMCSIMDAVRPTLITLRVLPTSPGEWKWKLAMVVAVIVAVAMRRTRLIGQSSKLSWLSLVALPFGAGNLLTEAISS
ncbi:hypothetical protein FRC02_009751 [Tulasnella sp. 418]|nr:hypothetical protein FRC02_009751 [Tulasnella sp. 418]